MIDDIIIKPRESFLDYVFGGCEIGLQIAVDFTASNGDPTSPHSLHYWNPQHNQYYNVIKQVGAILENYDSDKAFPLYGFGGMLPSDNRASHCFAMNGNIFNPEVKGIDRVLQCYQSAITKARLSGPTNFADVLRQVNEHTSGNDLEQS